MNDTKTQSPSDARNLASLRHLYANLTNGGVRDTASAKRIAEGLLAPVIEAMESGAPAAVGEPWGAFVGGRVFVGNLPEHARKLAESEGLPIQWLYLAPEPAAERKPLTPEQIAEGFANRPRSCGLFMGGVRFAEQAHGITTQGDGNDT